MNNATYEYDICIIGGAGHVGLPLGLVFASEGKRVMLYDINGAVLEEIAQGNVPHMEQGAAPILRDVLQRKTLSVSTDMQVVGQAATVIITIGTPIDEFMNPVFNGIKQCLEDIFPYVSQDQLIILRSTVYPGTTDWCHRYFSELGRTMKVAFCPERVVQGLAISEIRDLPQIISGTTTEAIQAAQELFSSIAPDQVLLEPMEAEFAKLFNNAYRYIEFAIANQFYMITNSAGVDFYRVLEGMKKNYPRARGIPGAGFAAGPCLYKDTMQLMSFAANNFSLGNAAVLINEGMVLYVIDQLKSLYRLEAMKVGLLGMAFKADNDDIRSSLSYKLKKHLALQAKQVLTTDPYVTVDKELLPLDYVLEESDLLILCVPHSTYKHLDLSGKPSIDIWGYLTQDHDNVVRVLVG